MPDIFKSMLVSVVAMYAFFGLVLVISSWLVWRFYHRDRLKKENDVLEAKARYYHSMAEKNETEARRSKQPSHDELRAKISAMKPPQSGAKS